VVLAGSFAVPAPVAAKEQFIPLLVYRTGPYAPNGIPLANGFNDYCKLINARDGGINGVKILGGVRDRSTTTTAVSSATSA
jgi:branched-chain amino acid transport system substrate-binding protein